MAAALSTGRGDSIETMASVGGAGNNWPGDVSVCPAGGRCATAPSGAFDGDRFKLAKLIAPAGAT